jgi:AraC family transcriptional regulator
MPRHVHNEAHFYMVLAGRCADHHDRKSFYCPSMAVIAHPAGRSHAATVSRAGARLFGVECESSWLESNGFEGDILQCSAMMNDPKISDLSLRLHREFLTQDSISRLAIAGLTLELLAYVLRFRQDSRHAPPWLSWVHDLLLERFDEDLPLGVLASEAGVHPAHLVKAFRRHFLTSIGEFVRQRRLERARRLVVESELALSEIAVAAGFFDQSHFSRHFRRKTGMPPGAYRRMYGRNR